jgi:hypothetical protein
MVCAQKRAKFGLKNAKRKELRFQPFEAGFPETVAQGFLVAANGIDVGSQKDAVVGRTVPERRQSTSRNLP